MKNKESRTWALILLGISIISIFTVSCKDKQDKDDKEGVGRIELLSGDNQTGFAGEPLKDSICIIVKDQNGEALQGSEVVFSASEGAVSKELVATGADGKASVLWTLGATEGEQHLAVTANESNSGDELGGSPILITAFAEKNLPNSIEYEGENSGDYTVKGVALDDAGNFLSDIKIECHLFAGDGHSIVGPLYVKTKEDGAYSFSGLPNPDQYNDLDIYVETFTLSASDYFDDHKYMVCGCWPAMAFGYSFPIPEMNKNLLLLEVNENTAVSGTIKYEDGTPVESDSLAEIGIGYGLHDEYGSFLIEPSSGNTEDELTGSFYDESTGEFKLMNCLQGGNQNYSLHANHLNLETYAGWMSHITINEGEENVVTIVISKN